VVQLPPGLDATPVTVVVVLAGEPIARAQEATGRKLLRADKESIKSLRRSEQDAILPQIQAVGGTVLCTFQSVINGIKVRIPANKAAALRQIPGVVDVKGVNRYRPGNVIGVPRVQAPALWAGVPGLRGEGIKIAVIDSGIDFTHANFGGPGTVEVYDEVAAHSTELPSDPKLFGPLAPTVKGGIDLSGDDYNTDPASPAYQPIPHPDPLDCAAFGHDSHVAGTIAGSGVLSTGATYAGPYDANTYANSFRIGPGVAPKASLYAVRVFGCEGETELVTEALDWALDNDMDVVNLSLGADYGTVDSVEALAADNAVKAGLVVVASAGNAGGLPYVTGGPSAASRAISVAAATTPASIANGDFALPAVTSPTADAARTILAINANGAAYGNPFSGNVKVVRTGPGCLHGEDGRVREDAGTRTHGRYHGQSCGQAPGQPPQDRIAIRSSVRLAAVVGGRTQERRRHC
jgi:minor extracellular serine protease Vpr